MKKGNEVSLYFALGGHRHGVSEETAFFRSLKIRARRVVARREGIAVGNYAFSLLACLRLAIIEFLRERVIFGIKIIKK